MPCGHLPLLLLNEDTRPEEIWSRSPTVSYHARRSPRPLLHRYETCVVSHRARVVMRLRANAPKLLRRTSLVILSRPEYSLGSARSDAFVGPLAELRQSASASD